MSKDKTQTTAVRYVVSGCVLTHVFTGVTHWLTTFSMMKVEMVQGDYVKAVEDQGLEGGQDNYTALLNTDLNHDHDSSIF